MLNWKKLIAIAVTTGGLLIATYLLYRTFSAHSITEIVKSVKAIPLSRLLMALAFAAASYLCLTAFDAVALVYAGKKLPYHQIALASFVALSIGHSVGMAGFSSGGLRYRYYSQWGLTTEDVAKIVLMCGVSVGVGMATLSGTVILLNPQVASRALQLNDTMTMAFGIGCIILVVGYLAMCAFIGGALKIWRWEFNTPSLHLAIAQTCIATINFALVAACLHALVASDNVSYLKSATAFILANTAVLVTHAPGGLGVLETTIGHVMGDGGTIGALVAFRAIYFFIPLLFGIPLGLIAEALMKIGWLDASNRSA